MFGVAVVAPLVFAFEWRDATDAVDCPGDRLDLRAAVLEGGAATVRLRLTSLRRVTNGARLDRDNNNVDASVDHRKAP